MLIKRRRMSECQVTSAQISVLFPYQNIVNIAFNLCKDGAGDTIYQKLLFSTFPTRAVLTTLQSLIG
jgi:hypothetical protein